MLDTHGIFQGLPVNALMKSWKLLMLVASYPSELSYPIYSLQTQSIKLRVSTERMEPFDANFVWQTKTYFLENDLMNNLKANNAGCLVSM